MNTKSRLMQSYKERRQQRIGEIQEETPVLSWPEFCAMFRWEQGEHVALIGPTGSGKTTLSMSLLPMRKFICATGTKPKDPTLKELEDHHGYLRLPEWRRLSPQMVPKRLIWPDAKDLHSTDKQREVFKNAFAHIYREGGWCVYIDELWFFIQHLHLRLEVETFLQQARSNNISMLNLTQRPAFVPLAIYDQSTHLFMFRDNDERNLKRLSGIGWLSAKLIQYLIANLERHQVLYINTKTGYMARTTPPPPKGG